MSNIVTLASKYRPVTFEEIVEQDSIKTILRNQLKSDSLRHAYLFCGSAGTGKAQPLDSLILTPSGYVKMGDVYIGQEVIDGKGNKTIITDIFPQGVKPIYKVTLSDKTSVLCSNEHLWKVGRYDEKCKKTVWEVLSVEELRKYKLYSYKNDKTTVNAEFIYELPTPIVQGFNSRDVTKPYEIGVNIEKTYKDIENKCRDEHLYDIELDKETRDKIISKNIYNVFLEKIKPYIFNSFNVRLSVLQGILDAGNCTVENETTDGRLRLCFRTSFNEVSTVVELLVRTLGGIDEVTQFKKGINYSETNLIYNHYIDFHNKVIPVTKTHLKKAFKTSRYEVKRKIVNIEYVGEQECQCIKVQSDDHTYITDNVTVTHNTTSARIIANYMNEGKATPIELDCASHNGIDDIRAIIDECKTKPMVGKYKIFLMDECFVPETEILTDKGYKQFKNLDYTEKIAQYTDDGKVEFVTPIRYIKKHYEGELECWQPKRGHLIKMTPNHQQPLLYNKSNKIKSKSICNIKFAKSNSLILSGSGMGTKSSLTALDRLVIICQAKGYMQYKGDVYNKWLVQFEEATEVSRFLDIIDKCNLEYTEIKSSTVGVRKFTFNTSKDITKELSTYFKLDFNYNGAREFIDEIMNWSGSITTKYIYYSAKSKTNANFISAVATLGGYSARQVEKVGNTNVKSGCSYELWLYDKTTGNCQYLQKYRYKEYYCGDVYCVEVPSHKIVVRAEGYTFISGNCHMLTTQAWNSLLKILEEPPEYVIFIFCTTDPQKILGTILSRVQRFNFSRISIEGITTRLKYIIDNENRERVNMTNLPLISFEDKAIDYIARLAHGGMRDSITTLEKCIDYSNNLSLSNVLTVTSGGVTEDLLLEMLAFILNKHCKEALLLFEQIYMSGVDVVLFLKIWTEYLQNCSKYVITQTIEITTLSEITVNRLNKALKSDKIDIIAEVSKLLDSVFQISNIQNTNDVKILIESWIIENASSRSN